MSTGRPTKLNLKVQTKIVKLLAEGNYVETAAASAGVNKSTLYLWLKRGARESQRLDKHPDAKPDAAEAAYLKFSNAIEKAEADAEATGVKLISAAADGQWQAMAWRLERKHPERWGRRDRMQHEHTGQIGAEVRFELPGNGRMQPAVIDATPAKALPAGRNGGNGDGDGDGG